MIVQRKQAHDHNARRKKIDLFSDGLNKRKLEQPRFSAGVPSSLDFNIKIIEQKRTLGKQYGRAKWKKKPIVVQTLTEEDERKE